MRASWKGSISFGMVYVPVNVYTATSGVNEIKFNQLHRKCNNRISYEKYCSHCDQEVEQSDIVKGFEYEKDKYIVITDEDYEKLPVKSKRTISIQSFVDEGQIDPIFFDKAYYIAPGNIGANKAFELFRRAMITAGKVGIAKITLSSNEYIAMIKPNEKGGMLLSLLYYANEIRDASQIAELNYNTDIHDNEIKMAVSLINNMSSDFNPAEYQNEYLDAVKQLIQAKIQGKEVVSPPEAQNNVIDLMEALKASVEATQKQPEKKTRAKRKTS